MDFSARILAGPTLELVDGESNWSFPLSLLRRILRPVLAAGAGLLLALSAAAPVEAEHPEPEPRDFLAEAVGEDNCTFFYTSGQAQWHATHYPEAPAVTISGVKSIAVPGYDPEDPHPCVPQPLADRQIQFTAYGDGFPISANTEPLGFGDSGQSYEFTFTGRMEIDTVTVAICVVGMPDNCGETQTITVDDVPDDPYCEYTYTVTQWDGGFMVNIGITPLVADSTGWHIEIDFPEGTSISSIWNANWTQSGSSVLITNTGWNGTIAAGSTTWVGFTGTGEPPAASDVRVYVNGNQCVLAEAA